MRPAHRTGVRRNARRAVGIRPVVAPPCWGCFSGDCPPHPREVHRRQSRLPQPRTVPSQVLTPPMWEPLQRRLPATPSRGPSPAEPAPTTSNCPLASPDASHVGAASAATARHTLARSIAGRAGSHNLEPSPRKSRRLPCGSRFSDDCPPHPREVHRRRSRLPQPRTVPSQVLTPPMWEPLQRRLPATPPRCPSPAKPAPTTSNRPLASPDASHVGAASAATARHTPAMSVAGEAGSHNLELSPRKSRRLPCGSRFSGDCPPHPREVHRRRSRLPQH